MKTFIAATLCVFCCLNNITINKKLCCINDDEKQKFESFISKFDIYGKPCLDKDFFQQRGERIGEMYTEINKHEYSLFIPYDSECNCEKDEFY